MSGMSDYMEAQVANASLRNIALQVAAVYVGLHTADPGDSTGANELTDSGYARKAATFGAPSGGVTAITAEVLFNAIADAGPFVVTHVSLWDAVSAGNLLYTGPLTLSKSFSQNDVPRFPVGGLTVTFE